MGFNMSLKDNWYVTGTDIDEFRSVMKGIADSTTYRRTSTAEIDIVGIGYETSKGPRVMFFTSDVAREFDMSGELKCKEGTLSVDRELYQETVENVGFFLRENNVIYYIAESALSSLFARAGIGGDAIYRKSLARNLFLEESLYKIGIGERGHGGHEIKSKKGMDQNCTLVVRSVRSGQDVLRKIFFVPTEKYAPIPMTALSDIAETICDDDVLGRPEVREWFADHNKSEICIVFPECRDDIAEAYKIKHSILPGILIRSSDTGQSCIEIRSVAFMGSQTHYLTLETTKRKHSGTVDIDVLLKEANEQMLRNVRKLPEVLVELLSMPVCTADLDTKAGRARNRRAVERDLTMCINRTKVGKVLGKKREIELRTALFAEINDEIPYTEYDIAMMVMSLGERMKETRQSSFIDDLCEACADVPFALLKYKKGEEEEDIFLGA